jgi:hypothetical protein
MEGSHYLSDTVNFNLSHNLLPTFFWYPNLRCLALFVTDVTVFWHKLLAIKAAVFRSRLTHYVNFSPYP